MEEQNVTKSEEAQPVVEENQPIVEAKLKKKGKFRKFMDRFIEEDLRSVMSWAAEDVLIPALKKMFVEFVDNSVNSMVYGRGSGKSSKSSTGNISYREYYDKPRSESRWSQEHSPSSSDIYSVGELEVPSEDAAVRLADRMDEYISRYGFLKVGIFMEWVNERPTSSDFDYGWSSVRGLSWHPTWNGKWVMKLPKVIPVDRR